MSALANLGAVDLPSGAGSGDLQDREALTTGTGRESAPLTEIARGVAPVWAEKLEQLIRRVGPSEVPVLLQGETGVGKEVLARRLHQCSPRAEKPFLKLNCAALPSELVESELFGYERGAFTGAFRSSPGKFELAHSGTILLDEIGDMDFKLQAKLLQVLQDGEFLRLGAKETCHVDVRVIAATHCDLEHAISEGRFREDLFYRLNIIRIEIPPLRERPEEILSLAQLFLAKYSKKTEPPIEISPDLRAMLVRHTWPGNIRELENVIRKFVVLRRADLVAEDLERLAVRRRLPVRSSSPFKGRLPAETGSDSAPELSELSVNGFRATPDFTNSKHNEITKHSILRKVDQARQRAETEAIVNALNSTLWNRKQAAKLLNVDYKALLYKMKKLGIGESRDGQCAC